MLVAPAQPRVTSLRPLAPLQPCLLVGPEPPSCSCPGACALDPSAGNEPPPRAEAATSPLAGPTVLAWPWLLSSDSLPESAAAAFLHPAQPERSLLRSYPGVCGLGWGRGGGRTALEVQVQSAPHIPLGGAGRRTCWRTQPVSPRPLRGRQPLGASKSHLTLRKEVLQG